MMKRPSRYGAWWSGSRIRMLVPPAGLEPATRGLGIHKNPSHGVNFVPYENHLVSENDQPCPTWSLHITPFCAQYGNKMATVDIP
jgi:hypothetical protein